MLYRKFEVGPCRCRTAVQIGNYKLEVADVDLFAISCALVDERFPCIRWLGISRCALSDENFHLCYYL